MTLEDVLRKYTSLTFQGFRAGEPIKMSDRIDHTIQWLQNNFKPNKAAGHGPWAQSFKHVMERSDGVYVSRGEFLAAAVLAGFPISKNEHVGISSKSMLEYDLKRVGHLPFTGRYGSDLDLLKWDIKQHYKWSKMKHDNSIPDDYVKQLKEQYPNLHRDGMDYEEYPYPLELHAIKKAAGWLKTMGLSEDEEFMSLDDAAVAMERCTNFYPSRGNMIAAIMWLKLPTDDDYGLKFNKKSLKRMKAAYDKIEF